MTAIREDELEIARELIQNKADIDLQNNVGGDGGRGWECYASIGLNGAFYDRGSGKE